MKRKIALCAATLALAGGVLAGCKKNKDDEVKLSSVTFSGISNTYKTDETIAWENMVVTFKYSDDSAISFTSDKMEFDVDAPVKSETELLVKTEGLHDSTAPHEEGRYYISVALKEDFTKFYDAGSIAVGIITKDKYSLLDYALPANIGQFNTTGSLAGKEAEGSFKKFNDDFIVGTVNPWKFEPKASFCEKADITKIDDFTNYEKDERLYVVNGTQETEVSAADYERIVLGGGEYQFASQDAGKKFKIVVSPKEFSKNRFGDAVAPATFTFNVMEGYNIYNAKQLGVLNLTNLKSEDFHGDHAYEEHYRKATASLGEDDNGQSGVFIVNPGEANPYGHIDHPRVWENFLLTNGVLTESTVAAARDVKGIFLQNDIDIKTTDIPSEYFINAYDPVNSMLQGYNTGALRDDVAVYAPTTMNELTISGNYFKLDSSAIPLCKNTTDGSTCDAIAKGLPIVSFTPDWSYQIAPGHATLFKICGVDINKETKESQTYKNTVKPAVFKNMLTTGNTGDDIGDATDDLNKKMKVTGLIFAKATCAPVTFDNVIAQEYMIGLFADNGLGQKVGDHKQVSHVFVKDCKVFDCSNSGLFNYEDGGLEVSGTTMKRFGGACIINAGCSGNDGYLDSPNSIFHDDCVFENYITGGEVYFAAVGASSYIAQIQGFNAWFVQKGAESKKNLVGPEGDPQEGKMNLIALQMDGDGYVSATNGIYSGAIVLNSGTDKQLKVELGSNQQSLDPMTAWASTEKDAGFVMPSDGGSSYAEGAVAACAMMQGDLLDLDICLGTTVLSCVFDLFDVPQKTE